MPLVNTLFEAFGELLRDRQDLLVRVEAARRPGKRNPRRAVFRHRSRVNAGVAGRRRADQFVERHVVGPCQREQHLKGRAALARLDAREGADRQAGQLGDLLQRRTVLPAHRTQPGPDRVEDRFEVVSHRSILRFPQSHFHLSGGSAHSDGMTQPTPNEAQAIHEGQDTDVGVFDADVAVVGGGLAGLGAALTLGRARRSVLVIDAGHPRNAPAAHMHGYLSRDGENPLEMLRMGRDEVRGYGGRVIAGTVTSIVRLEDGRFRLTTADGASYQARRVLVTTGLVDEIPDVPGLRERWGRDVVHCPYCFGWELRERALAVLGTGPAAVMQALMWRQWSSDVVLFLHTAPEPTARQSAELAARDIAVVRGEVAAIEIDDDRVTGARLASGKVHPRDAVVIAPWFEARHDLLGPLGATVVEHPLGMGRHVQADASGFTGVPGVWVAGNVLDLTAGVMQAAASGVTAAAALNADLILEDTERATTRA